MPLLIIRVRRIPLADCHRKNLSSTHFDPMYRPSLQLPGPVRQRDLCPGCCAIDAALEAAICRHSEFYRSREVTQDEHFDLVVTRIIPNAETRSIKFRV